MEHLEWRKREESDQSKMNCVKKNSIDIFEFSTKKKAFLVIKDCKGWIEGGGSHKSTTVDGG